MSNYSCTLWFLKTFYYTNPQIKAIWCNTQTFQSLYQKILSWFSVEVLWMKRRSARVIAKVAEIYPYSLRESCKAVHLSPFKMQHPQSQEPKAKQLSNIEIRSDKTHTKEKHFVSERRGALSISTFQKSLTDCMREFH